MRKHWITAVMMVALALVMTAPASAQVICKAEAQLCPTTGCTPTSASGQAEKTFQIAVTANPLLKIKALNAANQFDADVQGLKPINAYTITGSDSGGHTVALAVFGTDSGGRADVDLKNLAGQSVCSIKTVTVTQFGSTAAVLRGTFGVNDNPPEVEVEIQHEVQVEAELELNNIVNP
jgi:hypothetical protein